MLTKAKRKGHIRGLVPNLVEGGLTQLQYADDMILFMNYDDMTIRNIKFIMYCFEWMSGLKINYHKSEVYTVGLEESDHIRIANMLNCKVGVLPLVYLGIPVSDKHLGVQSLSGVSDKVRKRLQPWKGKHMSYGGRLMLTNTSLSSLPVYTMGVYRLQETIHQRLDTIRANFFWQGAGSQFKYHMVKWTMGDWGSWTQEP